MGPEFQKLLQLFWYLIYNLVTIFIEFQLFQVLNEIWENLLINFRWNNSLTCRKISERLLLIVSLSICCSRVLAPSLFDQVESKLINSIGRCRNSANCVCCNNTANNLIITFILWLFMCCSKHTTVRTRTF